MCDFHNFGIVFGAAPFEKISNNVEVIVQPPKTHFLTFSSETKIMKITHSEQQQGQKQASIALVRGQIAAAILHTTT